MSNKVALITGGASGIGKTTAKLLVKDGVTVVITGRRTDVGAQAVREIEAEAKSGAQVRFIENDVTDEAAMEALVESIVAEFGSLDMAVNNAGISNETTTIEQSDTDRFRAMLDTNVVGVYLGMKYQIRQMIRQGSGSIVNLASIAGLNGIPWSGPYAATKHAVVGLTKSAALDHARQGVRVNGVAPGATKTDIIARQLDGGDANYNEANISAMHPMNRLGTPDEIAEGIAFLLSDRASFITGHIISIDGGFQAK